jgi:hypothetical protein
MRSVALVSQLHAIDSQFGARCPRERQFDKRATSPPQSRNHSLTIDARCAAVSTLATAIAISSPATYIKPFEIEPASAVSALTAFSQEHAKSGYEAHVNGLHGA